MRLVCINVLLAGIKECEYDAKIKGRNYQNRKINESQKIKQPKEIPNQ